MDGLAVYAAIVGSVALGWQVVSYVLAGGRVKANFSPGMIGGGGLITGPASAFVESIQSLRAQGYDGPVVAVVQVRNVGRLPVTVSGWSVAVKPGGTSFRPIAESLGPALPHRLDAGEAASWAVDMARVKALVDATSSVLKVPPQSMRVRATVSLADGRTVKARGTL
jgi:hypothetical protein